MKTNYYYIDESGNISNNSEFFIHGCIKTDSPEIITDTLQKLKEKLGNDLYYEEIRESIIKKGFHATANSRDLQAELYKVLPLLNYRAYFAITKKDSTFFKNKMAAGDESDFFLNSRWANLYMTGLYLIQTKKKYSTLRQFN